MILKRCNRCRTFYPGQLQDPFNLCPIHNTTENRKRLVNGFKRTRSISINHFDVWDDSLPVKKGLQFKWERVCRVCGKRILNKTGKHSYYKRYCSHHRGSEIFFNFGSARYDKIHKVREENETLICLTYLETWQSGYCNPKAYVNCEKCGKLLRIWSSGEVEVHHIIPVTLLDESNFHLMWDLDNLQVLCHTCHKDAPEHNLFRPPKIEKPIKISYPNNRRLMEFMGEKS